MMLKYELKRLFTKRLTLFLLGGLVLVVIAFSLFAIFSVPYVNENGETQHGFFSARQLATAKNNYQGPLTPAVLQKITETEQAIDRAYSQNIPNAVYGKTLQPAADLHSLLCHILVAEGEYDHDAILRVAPAEIQQIYALWQENCQKMALEYGKTPQQQQFLMEQFAKTETPFFYEADDSFETMILYATTVGLILVVVIGFFAAGIFADEFSLHADAVFFATKQGRSKGIKTKIMAGMLMATVIYFGGIGLLSLLSFSVMGVSGFQTVQQIRDSYSLYAVTSGQLYLLVVLCGYVASLLSAAISMLVASKTRSANLATCLPFILFCVSPFISRAFSFNTFFQLTPDQLLNVINCRKLIHIYQFGNLVIRQIPLLLGLYSVVTLALLPLIYQLNRRGN